MSRSIIIGKIIGLIIRLFSSRGASALPGLIALKLNPDLIRQLADKNRLQSIIITGTNGKTTTSRLLGAILKANSTSYIHNRSGSNLMRGIASTLIKQTNLSGRLNSSLALWEIDEAVLLEAVKQLKPAFLLITNLFRDQLDRYGEIDTVLASWQQAAKLVPTKSKLVLNIDDPSLNYLAQSLNQSQSLVTYGLNQTYSNQSALNHAADAVFCPQCGSDLNFSAIFTSHLGHYHCPHCRFKRLKPDFNLLNSTKDYPKLPGIHSKYNILAATTLAQLLNISRSSIITGLSQFSPAFGRAEKFVFHSKSITIFLVKNPAGFNVTLQTLKSLNHLLTKPLLIILNDLIADGTDVSWIWDVDFEWLNKRQTPVVVSGLRAYDLALRLKYAGVKPDLVHIYPNLDQALNHFSSLSGSQGYILPTYTAMLALRKTLFKQKLLGSSWKD